MESLQDTPIFVWPDLNGKKMEGETYDFINGYHVYPKSRVALESQNREQIAGVQNLYKMRQRIEAVCKVLPQHNGDVVPWIVDDLVHFASTKEREMLPKLDYANPIFWYNISEECKSMMLSKIQRAKIQRAHDLAHYGKVDISITWYTGPDPETAQRMVMATPEQAELMKRAWDANFGILDGDLMHRKPRPKGRLTKEPTLFSRDDLNRDPRWVSYEENLAEPECQGGFYTCVNVDQLPALLALQQPWEVKVTTLIAPQRMSTEQQEEMRGYHAERRKVKEEAIEKKREEWECVRRAEMVKWAEKCRLERKKDTYERAMGRSREIKRCMDVPVNYYEGEKGNNGSKTKGYGQGTSSFMRLT